MRKCENCSLIDRPLLDAMRSCDPNTCDPALRDSMNPADHGMGCNKVLHEVRPLFEPATLVNTPRAPDGELTAKYRAEGWKVKRDGKNVFRWKMLCRNCIEKEAEREMVRKDYAKACKKARGQDDRTYGQLMIQQSQG
jgi:hypothetical protein